MKKGERSGIWSLTIPTDPVNPIRLRSKMWRIHSTANNYITYSLYSYLTVPYFMLENLMCLLGAQVFLCEVQSELLLWYFGVELPTVHDVGHLWPLNHLWRVAVISRCCTLSGDTLLNLLLHPQTCLVPDTLLNLCSQSIRLWEEKRLMLNSIINILYKPKMGISLPKS